MRQLFHITIMDFSCQLQLLIIAIETKSEDGTPEIAINPQKVKIKNATVGYVICLYLYHLLAMFRYFIAQDAEEVKRVVVFCKVCLYMIGSLVV